MTMAPLRSHVYCDVHGCVHERTGDPYDMGKPECKRENWRALYIKAEPAELDRRGKFWP